MCIERDPLDACVSILDARRKYYSDPAAWWSYVPVEYPLLKDLDPWEQVAGQVHYLGAYYGRELAAVGADASIRCQLPGAVQRSCRRPPPRLVDRRGRLRLRGGASASSRRPRSPSAPTTTATPTRRASRTAGPVPGAVVAMAGSRTVAIHQPNYLPWAGYFHKIARCDVFVYLDSVQFPRGQSFGARNRIKTPERRRLPDHPGVGAEVSTTARRPTARSALPTRLEGEAPEDRRPELQAGCPTTTRCTPSTSGSWSPTARSSS